VDLRYFELHDLLCDALIALEARDYPRAAAQVQRALAWAEADWLATPASGPGPALRSVLGAEAAADADDDE
jgi:hypothetical protein